MTYLRNAWYVAASAEEVLTTPMRRILLGEKVVLFRTQGGAVAALSDSCPHRFAPLSKGVVAGETLECGYHGLRFGIDGACVLNPHGDGAPPANARVRSYPALERYGYVWIWPGEAGAADPDRISAQFDFLDRPDRYAVVRGHMNIKANYQLLVDNLLDLTHVAFVHPQFGLRNMSAAQMLRMNNSELVRNGDSVCARRVRANSPPSDFNRITFGLDAAPVDTRSDMHWHAPANIFFDMGLTRPRDRSANVLDLPAAHLITPETETTSHYFFAQGRDAFIDDEEVSRKHWDFTHYAFAEQDEPMLEAQQANMGPVSDLMSLKPALLQTDGAPVVARRILDKLIAAEGALAAA